MISIRFNEEGFVADFDRVAGRLKRPSGLARVLGREAGNQLKYHFREKQQREPNKLGGKRKNFWRAVAQSVSSPTILDGGTAVRIAISHPAFAQKVHGGLIRAKRGKFLTIPVSKEAYGRTAATLEQERGIRLFALGKRDGQKGVLAELSTTRGVVVHYVLRRSVDQKPDRTALPMKGVLLNALLIRARLYADRLEDSSAN
jgi:hypothetical protein